MLTTTLHLTDDELLSLTHLRRPSAQARALQVMGVPYRTRPGGSQWVAVEPDGVRIFNARLTAPDTAQRKHDE